MIRHLFAISAVGYIRKDEPAEQFIRAVRTVAAGKVYLEPDAAGALIADLSRSRRWTKGPPVSRPHPADAADANDPRDDPARSTALLTPCELEVLHLIGSGLTTRVIASILHRSIKTIQT